MGVIYYLIILIISVVILGEILWYLDKREIKKRYIPYLDIKEYNNRNENYGKSFFIVLFILIIIIVFSNII